MFLMGADCGKQMGGWVGRTFNTLTEGEWGRREEDTTFQMKMWNKECLAVLVASILTATVRKIKLLKDLVCQEEEAVKRCSPKQRGVKAVEEYRELSMLYGWFFLTVFRSNSIYSTFPKLEDNHHEPAKTLGWEVTWESSNANSMLVQNCQKVMTTSPETAQCE